MKTKILHLTLFILSFVQFSYSQWTKGGTTKNFEEYRIIRDTVVETKTKKITTESYPSTSFKYVNFSYLSIYKGTKSKDLPNSNEIISRTGLVSPFYETGKIGANGGIKMSIGSFENFPFNKNLIPQLDISLIWEVNFAYIAMKFDRDEISGSQNLNPDYLSFLEDFSPSGYFGFSGMLGVGATFKPKPKDNLFVIDGFFKVGLGYLLGGHGSYTYDSGFDSEITNTEGQVFTPVELGFNLRFTTVTVGLSTNLNYKDNSEFTENYSINFSSSYSVETKSKVVLNHLGINLGFVF